MGFVSETVMDEGKTAKVKGRSMEANPYPAGSQESADWLEGFTYDEAEMNVDHPQGDEG